MFSKVGKLTWVCASFMVLKNASLVLRIYFSHLIHVIFYLVVWFCIYFGCLLRFGLFFVVWVVLAWFRLFSNTVIAVRSGMIRFFF